MDPVEYRAVTKLLYFKERTLKEMKEVYGDDSPSYDVVKMMASSIQLWRTSEQTAPYSKATLLMLFINTPSNHFGKTLRNHLPPSAQNVNISVGSIKKKHSRLSSHAYKIFLSLLQDNTSVHNPPCCPNGSMLLMAFKFYCKTPYLPKLAP